MRFFNTILDIVFPAKCVACGKSGADFCIECLGECREAERESEKWIFPLFDYRHPPIKKAVWLLKYKGKKRLADMFGMVIYDRVLEELGELGIMENFKQPIVIPIPLSQKRYRERGFNQAELIAKKLVALDGVDKNFELEKDILLKSKDTPHQARIENRSERLKNIIDSFVVENKDKIKNRNIILVDDVTTTGATLREAKKVLKESGAKKVIAFTIAH